MERPPGEVLPHLCRPLSAPTRCARGALAWSVAPRCARGLCGMRGRGPAGRIERRPRAASPPGGLAALAPGAPASPPSAASPRPPARPPAPVALGPGAPPGSPLRRLGGRRRAPGRGLAAPPPRGWRSARASLWFGLAALALPPLRPPSRALAAPRGPPSGPAAARRLRAARLPSLLPPRGRPGGGGRKDRAPLGGGAARASWPAAWVGCSRRGDDQFVRLRAPGWRLRRWWVEGGSGYALATRARALFMRPGLRPLASQTMTKAERIASTLLS